MSFWVHKFSSGEQDIAHRIKERLLSSIAIRNLFDKFEVSPQRLQDLKIEIVPLEGKYAETDLNTMRLNSFMFSGDFFKDYFFVVAHEIVHWLSRVKEHDSYFSDPEEKCGFVSAIAYELENGSSIEDMWEKIFPKVKWHFHNVDTAKSFFKRMIEKAKILVASHTSGSKI